MVTSTCVIVWLTISHYIVLAIFGNRDFFLKLHHQCFVFITLWICYNLTPPATSKHCLLYTFGQCCNELYMYTMNKELLLLHMYKMNSFSRASHRTMTSASLFCWPCSSPCICMHALRVIPVSILFGGGLFFPLWHILFVSCFTSCKNIKHVFSYH